MRSISPSRRPVQAQQQNLKSQFSFNFLTHQVPLWCALIQNRACYKQKGNMTGVRCNRSPPWKKVPCDPFILFLTRSLDGTGLLFSTTIRHLTILHLTKEMYFWSHSTEILKYLDEHKMCFLVPALPCRSLSLTEFHCFPFPFHFNSTQRAYNMSQKLENPQFLMGIFLLIYRLNIPVVGMFSVVVCTSLLLLSVVWRWLLFI